MIIPKGASCVHKHKPYIAEYKNFLNEKQCKAIMKLRKKLQYTQGQLRINGLRQVNLDQRNAFTHVVRDTDDYSLTRWIKHVADWLKLPSEKWIENTLLIHYPPGGEFKLHTDVVRNANLQGQDTSRIATVIVYLNTEFDGGHTEFPMHGITIKPETGKALLFCYNYPEEVVNSSTVHVGQKVTSDKYILVFFIRDQEYPDELRKISFY